MYMSKMTKQNTIYEYSRIVCTNCNPNANYDTDNKNNDITIITDPESGEHICTNCGSVLAAERAQEIGPEWRTFDSEQTKNSKIRT
jgi:transcription initiation factor TFIIIB Brf1 subunit/transcription initiation factor TFIIB